MIVIGRLILPDVLKQALIGLLIFAGYCLSFPANRSESDDGYDYAYIIAQQQPAAKQLYDLKFALFLPAMRAAFQAVRQLVPAADAYLVMCCISAACAALTLPVFYRLLHHLGGLNSATAFAGTALLGVSYHFWRYAVEAEVYMPAILLIAALFYQSLRAYRQGIEPIGALQAAVLAGAAVLMYKPNMIPVGFLLLLMWARRANRPKVFIIGTAAAIIVLAGYYRIFQLTAQEQETFVQYLFTGTRSPHRVEWSALKLLAVAGSLLLAPNFMYGFPAVQQFVRKSFAGQYVQDDIFAALQSPLAVGVAPLTLCLCIGLFALLIAYCKILRWELPQTLAAGWLLVYSALLLLQLDSFSPEPFVPLLLPAAYLATTLLFAPLATRPALPLAFVTTVFCHNLIGGLSIVYSPQSEWLHCQQEWLIRNTMARDVIIVHGGIVTRKKLQYRTPAMVIHLPVADDAPPVLPDTLSAAGRIFLLTDVAATNDEHWQPVGNCGGHLYLNQVTKVLQ